VICVDAGGIDARSRNKRAAGQYRLAICAPVASKPASILLVVAPPDLFVMHANNVSKHDERHHKKALTAEARQLATEDSRRRMTRL